MVARSEDLSLAMALAEEVPAVHNWLGLGRRETGPIRLVVVRSADRLGPAWGAGFAIPGARTVVVRTHAGDPHQVLRHELAHLALHDAIRARVPLWFDEGYAALAAGEIDRMDALRLDLAVARGMVPGFPELDRALRGAEAQAALAYGLAATAVSYLGRRHPEHSLAPLLGRLAGGEPFDAAVLATTGSPLGRLELEWQHDVRRRYGLLGWALAGGLWSALAVLLIAAVWLRRRRDRGRRAALDQGWVVEEDGEGPPVLDEAPPAP